jgi:hypothetical protein
VGRMCVYWFVARVWEGLEGGDRNRTLNDAQIPNPLREEGVECGGTGLFSTSR